MAHDHGPEGLRRLITGRRRYPMGDNMTLEDFRNLSDEEQSAYIKASEDTSIRLMDLETERDSFKNENEKLKSDYGNIEKELRKTKELNFTLARKIDNSAGMKTAEEILNDMFPTGRRGKKNEH